MKVLWTDSAVAQLQAIHDYLAQTSPDYAVRIVDRLTRRSIQIAAFPNSGRMVPEYSRGWRKRRGESLILPYRVRTKKLSNLLFTCTLLFEHKMDRYHRSAVSARERHTSMLALLLIAKTDF